ncbi:MAG: hypothetical protein EBZ77_04335, partial [Chitinophagia bacterium]|nr:hypothetical protein [Chitinophagia bacterium]
TLTNPTASSGTVTWSTADAAIASVNPTTGVVTGVSNGTVDVYFTVTSTSGCGSASDTVAIMVTSTPSAGTISGTAAACVGAGTSLTSSISGGVWSSSATSIATVDSVSGDVYALSAGSATIAYTVRNACGTATASQLYTVNALPATPSAISGTTTVCSGATTTLSSSPAGGSWTTTNSAVASVDASGVVYGVSGGTADISYTISSAACGSSAVGTTVTVTAAPAAATVSGATSACISTTTTLSPSISGGTWSTINAAVASVDASGTVYAVTADTTSILYTISGTCGATTTATLFTVNPAPATPAAIGGATSVCVSSSTTLTNAVSGGTWATLNASVASVNATTGLVYGVTNDTTTITYTISNSCGTNRVSALVTVIPVPVMGNITGAGNVCTSGSLSLSDTTAGGTWSTSAASVASVTATGVVNGVAVGSAIITYSKSTTCGTISDTALITVITIPAAPGAVAGAVIAYGGSTTLSSSTSGGRWSSSAPAVATVDTVSGVVTAVSSGSAIITYTVRNACGSNIDTALVTVSGVTLTSISGTQWNSFSGSSATGPSTFTVLPATTTPGSSVINVSQWNRSGTTSNSGTGYYNTQNFSAATTVSGALSDNRFIYFTVTNNSSTEAKLTNLSLLTQRSGTGPQSANLYYCTGSSGNIDFGSSTQTIPSSSGTVSFNGTACIAPGATDTFKLFAFNPATAGATGGTVRVLNGTSITMSYATSVTALSLSSSSNTSPVCAGSNFSLSAGTASNGIAPYTYAWSGPASYASTATAPTITGATTAAAGAYTLTATDNLGCFISNTTVATVTPIPRVSPISGSSSVSLGSSVTLTDTASGGTWSSSNTSVASVSSTGVVTGMSAGSATIKYRLANSCGADSATTNITVTPVLYITNVSPNTASSGASVTISGANFNSTLNKNIVYFGATRVTPTSGSTTSLTVSVPSGALYAPVSVTDTAKGTTAFSGQHTGSALAAYTPVFDTTGFLTDSMNFKNKVDFTVTSLTGSKPLGAAIGDINGDGKADLVSANADSSSVTILINNSASGTITSSSFTTATKITLPSKPNIVKLADLDGDGKLDIIATATNNNSFIVIRNTTASTSSVSFATRQQVQVNSTSAVAGFGDFNGDGRTDVVVSQPRGKLAIMRNTSTIGNISFGSDSAYVTTGAVPSSVIVTDLDGDGLADLATVNSGFTGLSYTGNTASAYLNTSSAAAISFGSATTITTGSGPIDITSGDVDGDGKMDLFFTNINDGNFSVLRNTSSTGSLSFGTRTSFTAGTGATGINVADLNGDGKVDVVVSNALGTSLSIFRNTTTGTTPSFATAVTKTTGSTPTTVTLGDLDNDGYSDIVVGNQGANTISVFENYPLPRMAPITGTTTLCATDTATLRSAVAGGTWSTSNAAVASVNASGFVTAVAAGSATISYTKVINGDTNYVTTPFTVNASAFGGVITGVGSLCPATSLTLTNPTASGGTGSWSSSAAAIATIDPTTGVITGVTNGSVIVTYTVTSASCGTAQDTAIINVTSTPSAGTISGTTTVCQLATTSENRPEMNGVKRLE